METISIMVRRSSNRLEQRLGLESAFLEWLSFCWRDCGACGRMVTLSPACCRESGADREGFIESLASMVIRFIIEDLKTVLLYDLICCTHFHFAKKERRKILRLACESLDRGRLQRCFEFYRSLLERYLEPYRCGLPVHLDIEGFYRFRMHGFQQELLRAVDHAVNGYLVKEEHREFVRFLRYFLNLQHPGSEAVHLFVDEEGHFEVRDRRFERIDAGGWEELSAFGFDERNDYEDILISMLVSMAPRQVVLHQGVGLRHPRVVKNLCSVFGNRLVYCKNCPCCRWGVLYLVTGGRGDRPGSS